MSRFSLGSVILNILLTFCLNPGQALAADTSCVHDLWLLGSPVSANFFDGDPDDAPPPYSQTAALRFAMAEYLFINRAELGRIGDDRTLGVFESIARGKYADPEKIANAAAYRSLFEGLKQRSSVLQRLESEYRFIYQSRQNLVASEEIIFDLPKEIDDVLIAPKSWKDNFTSWLNPKGQRRLAPLEIQQVLAQTPKEKKLAVLTKTVASGIQPVTLGEAIRLSSFLPAQDQAAAIQLFLPRIFNDFTFYVPLDGLAMLKNLTPEAATRLAQKFPLDVSTELFDKVVANPKSLIDVGPYLSVAKISFSKKELEARISRATDTTELKLYVTLYRRQQGVALTGPLVTKLEADKKISAEEKIQLLADIDSPVITDKSKISMPTDFSTFVEVAKGIADLQFRSAQIRLYVVSRAKLTDLEFITLYDLLPKQLGWGDLDGWGPIAAELNTRFGSNWAKTGFAPNEILVPWDMLKKINKVTDIQKLTKTYNGLQENTANYLKRENYLAPFILDVQRMINLEFSRLIKLAQKK